MVTLTSAIFSIARCIIFIFVSLSVSGAISASFTFTNNCGYTVWPCLLSNPGTTPFETTWFMLNHGKSRTLTAPQSWSGRFCVRTACTTDSTTGNFSCETGNCDSNNLKCFGGSATHAEFTLDGSAGTDFYDTSLVHGFNLPLSVVSQNVVFETACDISDRSEYCHCGAYGNWNTSEPSAYSQFQSSCPRVYSYAYNDANSIINFQGANYLIAFCPSTTNDNLSARENMQTASLPLVNGMMPYLGEDHVSSMRSWLPRIFTFVKNFMYAIGRGQFHVKGVLRPKPTLKLSYVSDERDFIIRIAAAVNFTHTQTSIEVYTQNLVVVLEFDYPFAFIFRRV